MTIETFSSHGEDRVIDAVLARYNLGPDDDGLGIFVDVGGYHPRVASNSAVFYDRGWLVVAVEPNPFMAQQWRELAPRAIVHELAVAEIEGEATFHFFYDWASSNTMVASFAAEVEQNQNIAAATAKTVTTLRLENVLRASDLLSRTIHVMNIDVEGFDLQVLRSNNWDDYRPRVLAVEDLDMDLASPDKSETYRVVCRQGYHFVSHAVLTSIYVDSTAI